MQVLSCIHMIYCNKNKTIVFFYLNILIKAAAKVEQLKDFQIQVNSLFLHVYAVGHMKRLIDNFRA